jgi:hypothetical protein
MAEATHTLILIDSDDVSYLRVVKVLKKMFKLTSEVAWRYVDDVEKSERASVPCYCGTFDSCMDFSEKLLSEKIPTLVKRL